MFSHNSKDTRITTTEISSWEIQSCSSMYLHLFLSAFPPSNAGTASANSSTALPLSTVSTSCSSWEHVQGKNVVFHTQLPPDQLWVCWFNSNSNLPSSIFFSPSFNQSQPAGYFSLDIQTKPRGFCICVPALRSSLLPPSIRSCIPASPQPASPCQPQALPLHFQSWSKTHWSQQKTFYCLPGPLDQLYSSSLKPTLYIKLSLMLASVVSHIPKVNYSSFPQLPVFSVLSVSFSGFLLKDIIRWLL